MEAESCSGQELALTEMVKEKKEGKNLGELYLGNLVDGCIFFQNRQHRRKGGRWSEEMAYLVF